MNLVPCPYCKGSGKVSKERAEKKISVRDKAKYNATMKGVNKRKRDRAKHAPNIQIVSKE